MGYLKIEDLSAFISALENKLSSKTNYDTYENISEKILKRMAEQFSYIFFCPPKLEMDKKAENLEKEIKIFTPKEILIILNRILHAQAGFATGVRDF